MDDLGAFDARRIAAGYSAVKGTPATFEWEGWTIMARMVIARGLREIVERTGRPVPYRGEGGFIVGRRPFRFE